MKKEALEKEGIRGWLHHPDGAPRAALGLTHGAGLNCGAPLLVAVAEAFALAGFLVLRYDLPFRQLRPKGPPLGSAKRDQEGIRTVARELRGLVGTAPLILAGHSYGGRQTTMAAAADPDLADSLLLLSYPLHPPGKPEKPRTEHFPQLRTPAVFVHGTRDEFGSIAELEAALRLIPAACKLVPVDGAGHGLPPRIAATLPGMVK